MNKNINDRLLKIKKRIKEIISIINITQILDFLIFPIIVIISFICKPFCSKDIWIIAENPNEACDNGYIFFKYLREHQKQINAYYVINKKSKDYNKVSKYGNIIQHRSLKHWIYYLNSSKIIVSQKYANPSPALFYILHTKNIIKNPRIYLKHGILKDYSDFYHFSRTNFRLFICGAKREYEYIKNKYGYPDENVVYTGLARYDNLNIDENLCNKQILIAPTWRKWIRTQKEFDCFMQNYYKIINDNFFIDYLEKREIKIKIILHKNMKIFKIQKHTLSKNISINHNEEVEIQELLNTTDLLLTDYSSLFFDIAYRKKPIIFYQFDLEKYRENQLQEGYFSYKNDGFGEILKDSDSVIKKMIYYIDNNYNVEDIYLKRMDKFFERKDKSNCMRIFEEINKI